MKNTLWTKRLSKSTVSVLNKAGFYTNEDFNDVPVMGLLLMEGIDREDVDDLLQGLYYGENSWRLGIRPIIMNATEKEGQKYMKDIFEDYNFSEYPEFFYKMTVRELLDLDFIEEKYIPFVTSLMQRYLEEQREIIDTSFTDRTDIVENFEEIFSRIINPICDLYGLYGYDEDEEDEDDDEFDFDYE